MDDAALNMARRALTAAQEGHLIMARHHAVTALGMGCPKGWFMRKALADSYQTLSNCAALFGRYDDFLVLQDAAAQFDEEGEDGVRTKAIQQLRRLGLLGKAPELLKVQLARLKDEAIGVESLQSQIKILEGELQLLQHELGIAQTRGQLAPGQLDTQESLAPEETLKRKAMSQLGQELWVLERTGYKRNGFFVEFGATDGVLLSNTWLLEKEFGWKGICAEPNPEFFLRLQKNRSCLVTPACIGPRTGEIVQFVFAGAFGGLQSDIGSDQHSGRRQSYLDTGHTAALQTISLHDLLVQCGAPKEIDYISIDTEGSEFRILETFPFDQWNVRHFTIEHNYTEQREKIYALLSRHGYTRIEQQWDDWYWR